MKTRVRRYAVTLGTAAFLAVCVPFESSAAMISGSSQKTDAATQDPGEFLANLGESLDEADAGVPDGETGTPAAEEPTFSGFADGEDPGTDSADVQFTTRSVQECELSWESGAYGYAVNDTDHIYLSVPDGAVSKEPVQIQFSSGNLGIYSIEHDGADEPDILARTFTEEGTYRILLYDIDTETAAVSGSAGVQIPVTFQIRNGLESEKRAITEPTGFRFQSVTVDGQAVTPPDQVLIPDRDGTYEIVFASRKNPEITYTYSVDIDTTAPELRFSKDVESGKLWTPVSYETVEPDSEVHVYRDYREYEFADQTLTRGGSYRIVVSDPAGNSRTYSFQVKENPAKKILACIGGGVILLAGIVVYMRYIREHMNIL